MTTSCMCEVCRREVSTAIDRAFQKNPTWMNTFEIAFTGNLDWVPDDLLESVIAQRRAIGTLLTTRCEWPWGGDAFRMFLPFWLAGKGVQP